jgi:hypothetical protein
MGIVVNIKVLLPRIELLWFRTDTPADSSKLPRGSTWLRLLSHNEHCKRPKNSEPVHVDKK